MKYDEILYLKYFFYLTIQLWPKTQIFNTIKVSNVRFAHAVLYLRVKPDKFI